ncbi:MAG: hypothetical protein NVSMB24_25220 [Mucilaginibacter sp.]
MKTILTKFLALSGIALLMLSACKKDGALVTTNGGKAGTLTASTTTPVLDKTKLSDTTSVVRFNFSAANYGFSAAVTNTLQIDAVNDNWAKPMSVSLSNKVYSQGYSTSDFNALLLKLNLPAGVASQVQVRVVHSISADVKPIYSNVLTLTATPFNLTSYLYVAGAYEGWANPGPQEDSLVSVTGNGVYTGIINFTAGNNQFLILPAKNWNHKYATTDAQGTTSSTVKYDGPNNFYAPSTAGKYQVTINTNTNTISFAQANSYSIIGDAAQGWGTDVAMKFINDGTNTWVATLPLVSTGSFKVRQNNDWTFSWGIPKAGSAGDGVAGTLNDTSNNNITVSATGSHTVSFTIPITSVGTTPPVTATYSVK